MPHGCSWLWVGPEGKSRKGLKDPGWQRLLRLQYGFPKVLLGIASGGGGRKEHEGNKSVLIIGENCYIILPKAIGASKGWAKEDYWKTGKRSNQAPFRSLRQCKGVRGESLVAILPGQLFILMFFVLKKFYFCIYSHVIRSCFLYFLAWEKVIQT